ncbi:MAG: DUF2264 domain-containing protein [Verrucomicrobia bacterium]|nr:MAG: DUF2264 domain-containing protein [Verrucomicrobiota bacterium]
MTDTTPYQTCLGYARRLLEPLAALMQPGRADLPIIGPASDHDAQADRLESFARPMLLAAFWLQAIDRDGNVSAENRAFRDRIAAWFHQGLALGTDPAHPQYWGPDANYHQHHVEMGLMAIALQFARESLWEPLAPVIKDQVAAWFGTCRGGGIVNNNHLFMSVHILEFLRTIGHEHRTDATVIEHHLDQLETMHRGGGWFEDGINQAYDHYNAYAFHFYGLCWARLHGHRDPARAERWRGWARLFIDDYQHFFAASGEHPAFGRSIMYRFNAVNVFGLGAAEGCSDLPPGRLRRLCLNNITFFLNRPITQEQGCLAFGWLDHFEDLAEAYSCAASPYWAAKGFALLLIPPDQPFWTAPDTPVPAEEGDFVRKMPVPGMIVRGVGGEVEILNGSSMVGNTQLRYGAWKWSKTAYRTGTGFTLSEGPPPTDWSFDAALTATLDDGRVFGRHSTVCVEIEDDHIGYAYNLGWKVGQVNTGVETFVWWRRGWLLLVHHVHPRQPVILRQGGYALPAAEPRFETVEDAASGLIGAFAEDGRGTALQPLLGFETTEWDERLDASKKRRHLHAP